MHIILRSKYLNQGECINMDSKKRASEVLLDNYNTVIDLFKKYNVDEVRVFGSIFVNSDTNLSDVDFIVNFSEKSTLFEYGKLKFELENVLQLSTDMLTYSGLNKEVLEHFRKNSLSLYELKEIRNNNSDQKEKTEFDKLKANLRSIVWVIDRIQECCKNVTKDVYMTNETIQDAVTRNIQLLGEIVSQIPSSELEQVKDVDTFALKGCITLRDALFMNVDYDILWNTINMELEPLKYSVQKILKE